MRVGWGQAFSRAPGAAHPNCGLPHKSSRRGRDRVVTRWELVVTKQREPLVMPATGREVRITGIDGPRVTDGRITDVRRMFDVLEWLSQLGVAQMVPPAAAGA